MNRALVQRRLLTVAALILPISVVVIGFVLDIPTCPSKALFGVPCPGCGLTRGTLAMLGLSFEQMWHFHPLTPILAPLMVFALFDGALIEGRWLPAERSPSRWLARHWPKAIPLRWIGISLAALVLATWLYRLVSGTHVDGVHFEQGALLKHIIGAATAL